MLTMTEYIVSWLIYLVGVLGAIVVWWMITRKIPYLLLRNILRFNAAVILLVPYPILGYEQLMAPAFIMSLLEWLFSDVGFLRSGTVVIVAVLVVNVSYLVLALLWRLLVVRRRGTDAEVAKAMAARTELLKQSNAVKPQFK